MTRLQRETRIAKYEELLDYHLGNVERAEEVGSPNSAERNLEAAAHAASILTALKGIEP